MKEYIAFIDESGDPVFPGSTSEYFVGAIVISKEDLSVFLNLVNDILVKYNLKELKSQKISSLDRRIEILNIICNNNFKFVSIRVEKNKLEGNWFKYKNTFYKWIHGRLNQELYNLFGNLDVKIDRFGTEEYQKSLHTYLETKLQEELFEPSLEISSAKVLHIIQLTDFLSGTVRKYLSGEFPDNFLDDTNFEGKWVRRINIPEIGKNYFEIEYSKKYFETLIVDVKNYLEVNHNNPLTPKYKTIEYLYYNIQNTGNDYVYTNELLGWLEFNGIHMTDDTFRAEVVAKLRDDKQIITSTRRGYKLPLTELDIIEFIDFSSSIALPILKRLRLAVEKIDAKYPELNIKTKLDPELRAVLEKINA